MAPRKGFEPSTYRLTAECSTVELSRNDLHVLLYQDKIKNQYVFCKKISFLVADMHQKGDFVIDLMVS